MSCGGRGSWSWLHVAQRQHPRLPCPLHRPVHPPLTHCLGIDDGVALSEGDLVSVHSSVAKLGYVVGVILDRRRKGQHITTTTTCITMC